MTTEIKAPQQKSFVRQWGLLICFGIFVCAFLAGVRFWMNQLADAPVEDGYATYLNVLAANSKGATEQLNRYYRRYERKTIASRHFESICGAVTVLADHDGFDPEKVSVDMARACRTFTHGRTRGEVPDL